MFQWKHMNAHEHTQCSFDIPLSSGFMLRIVAPHVSTSWVLGVIDKSHSCAVLTLLPICWARALPSLFILANASHSCYWDDSHCNQGDPVSSTVVIYIPLTVHGVEFFHISTGPFDIFFIGIAIWVLWPLLNCSICFLAIELVPYIFWTLASFQICFANTLSLWESVAWLCWLFPSL